jgi:hypothetical protein
MGLGVHPLISVGIMRGSLTNTWPMLGCRFLANTEPRVVLQTDTGS